MRYQRNVNLHCLLFMSYTFPSQLLGLTMEDNGLRTLDINTFLQAPTTPFKIKNKCIVNNKRLEDLDIIIYNDD